MTPVLQSAPIAISPEVAAFAAASSVTAYLPAVIEMTQQVFPEARLRVVVEDDPEIANDLHLVLLVMAPHLSVSEALEARWQWHAGLFDCCPRSLAITFRLGLELKR